MVARWTGETFSGAHIRVSLLLTALGRYRRFGEIWCFGVGTYLSWLFAYYAVKMTYGSWKWNDISQGQDATPMWIPQTLMSFGVIVLAIAFADHLVRLIFIGSHNIQEEALNAHLE